MGAQKLTFMLGFSEEKWSLCVSEQNVLNRIFISVLLQWNMPTWSTIFQCSRVKIKILLRTFCFHLLLYYFCPLKLSLEVSGWAITEGTCLLLYFGRVVGPTAMPSIFIKILLWTICLWSISMYIYVVFMSFRMLCKLQSWWVSLLGVWHCHSQCHTMSLLLGIAHPHFQVPNLAMTTEPWG